MVESPRLDEEGKMHLPAGVQTVEESIKQTQLAQSGLKLGVVLVVGSYLLIILAGVLLILLAVLCGMSMGSSCGDDGFESLVSWMSVGSVGIKLGLVVFVLSAVAKLVIEFQLEAGGVSVETKPAALAETMVKAPFVPGVQQNYDSQLNTKVEVQCPKCSTLFTVGTD